MRDKEYSLKKPPNTFRVVVLGDSFTMPGGVNIESAYHSILERQLTKERKQNYEFINFGVSRYSPVQYLAVLESKAMKYKPDHILVGICLGNDFPTVINRLEKKVASFTASRNINSYYRLWSYWVLKNRVIHDKGSEGKTPNLNLRPIKHFIREFKRISEENNIGLTLVALRSTPLHPEWLNKRLSELKKITSKYNVHLIDTTPIFANENKEMRPQELHIYRLDSHPNDKANKLFAESIKRNLNF